MLGRILTMGFNFKLKFDRLGNTGIEFKLE